jgi:large subunit ribosomal protein L6
MSRIGKKPISIEKGVTVSIENGIVHFSGSRGQLDITLGDGVRVKQTDSNLVVSVANEESRPLQGLFRTLLNNAIIGVTGGWTKKLELVGVGFRAESTGSELTLNVGFSHSVKIKAPSGITFTVSENKITVSGADKYLVGETAAKVKAVKPPEHYKGKGIRYEGEIIRKKAGKAAKVVGGAATK